jgi:DNA-binding NarL/FixJ family response regulator
MEKGEVYDAVVLDLTVPGQMGGRETVREILELDPQARVIVSSGYFNDPIMADYKEWGFKGVIPKPYGVKELSETIASIIREQELA